MLATAIRRLYTMLRDDQQWRFDQPDVNDRGQPVIHDIVSKLGCMLSKGDFNLPASSLVPEDNAGFVKLATQLEAQQSTQGAHLKTTAGTGPSPCQGDHVNSSGFENFGTFEYDVYKSAFNDHSGLSEGNATGSPTISTSYIPWGELQLTGSIRSKPPLVYPQPNFYADDIDKLNEGFLELEWGPNKLDMLPYSNLEAITGVGEPMIYPDFERGISLF